MLFDPWRIQQPACKKCKCCNDTKDDRRDSPGTSFKDALLDNFIQRDQPDQCSRNCGQLQGEQTPSLVNQEQEGSQKTQCHWQKAVTSQEVCRE